MFTKLVMEMFPDTTSNNNIVNKRRKRSIDFDRNSFNRMNGIFQQVSLIKKENCHMMQDSYRILPGDSAYGVEEQFDSQARSALRISHFLSNFYQNVIPGENFGKMKGGHQLNVDHLFGEVFANLISDHKIMSSGIFFEPYEFKNANGTIKELFGPWGFKKDSEYFVLDTAGHTERYTDESWYRSVAERWKTNTYGLNKYFMKALIRSDPNGTSALKHEYYPVTYWAPSVKHGTWSRPYFRCDGNVDKWVIGYTVPFFGLDELRKDLRFK